MLGNIMTYETLHQIIDIGRYNGVISNHKESRKQIYIDMGKRLRQIRHNLDYTQEQVAELIEVTPAYYGKIERGVHGLSVERLIILNQKLNVDPTYILTGKKNTSIILDKVFEECPMRKRYDLEQILKYALNLAKESE